MDAAPETPKEKRCRCGFDRTSPMVHEEPKYNLWGWFLISMGATPRPIRVEYRCSRCRTLFGSTRDPEVLKKIG